MIAPEVVGAVGGRSKREGGESTTRRPRPAGHDRRISSTSERYCAATNWLM